MKLNPSDFKKVTSDLFDEAAIKEHIEVELFYNKTDLIKESLDIVIQMREQGLKFDAIARFYESKDIHVSGSLVQKVYSEYVEEIDGEIRPKEIKRKKKVVVRPAPESQPQPKPEPEPEPQPEPKPEPEPKSEQTDKSGDDERTEAVKKSLNNAQFKSEPMDLEDLIGD